MPRPENAWSTTRATLLLHLKDWQNHASWEEFFDLYGKLIFSVASKAGLTSSEAEEVVQETMLSVAKHMPGFKYDPKIGSFKTWLLNLTRWRINDQFRKRGPLAEDCFRSGESSTGTRAVERLVDPASLDMDALWVAEWEKQLLGAAVTRLKSRLDPEKYQIFDLYVNQEWPPDKVAKTFGVSVDQVYLAKHRITETIKAEVRRLEQDLI
jgi:RNA polymerase sigma factor (sigma-70 family)